MRTAYTPFTEFPQSQSILIGLINYYLKSNESTDRLFELLDKAKANEPNNASLFYVEGNIRSQLGDTENAVKAYRKCAEINPEVDQYSTGGKTVAENKSNANMMPGFDWGSYPVARVITAGFKLTF